MWVDQVAQYVILILGPTAVFLVGSKGRLRRWGYLVGLLTQPWWFITLYCNGQWPVLVVSIIYTVSWANGVRNYIVRRGA